MIEELIALARDMQAANKRGVDLGLSDDEVAFYDALETNDSAVRVLGEPTLNTIAREPVAAVRKNVTIDLDRPRERPRQPPRHREAHPSEVRLSAG